jgi:phosphatidylserine synthase
LNKNYSAFSSAVSSITSSDTSSVSVSESSSSAAALAAGTFLDLFDGRIAKPDLDTSPL